MCVNPAKWPLVEYSLTEGHQTLHHKATASTFGARIERKPTILSTKVDIMQLQVTDNLVAFPTFYDPNGISLTP
jgi:hypothetical protein